MVTTIKTSSPITRKVQACYKVATTLFFSYGNRKRKLRLAASAQDRSTELSQQRKRMRLLRDRETPARRSARLEAMRQRTNERTHFNIATYTF